MAKYREEEDVLGVVRVPSDAYYGSETQRALDNFNISGIRMQQELVYAYAAIKLAAAKANMKIGKLDVRKGNAIVKAFIPVPTAVPPSGRSSSL